MTEDMVQQVVVRLFTIAGRRAGKSEFLVWGEALADLPDEHALEVAQLVVKNVDLGKRHPTPALYRETFIAHRLTTYPELREAYDGPWAPDEHSREHMRVILEEARKKLTSLSTKGKPRQGKPAYRFLENEPLRKKCALCPFPLLRGQTLSDDSLAHDYCARGGKPAMDADPNVKMPGQP